MAVSYADIPWVRPVAGPSGKLPLILRNPIDDNTKRDYLKCGPSIVMKFGPGDYRMYYEGLTDQSAPNTNYLMYATSPDGYTWTKYAGNPVLTPSQAWEVGEICPTSWFWNPSVNQFWMYYHGGNNLPIKEIGLLTSPTALPGTWTRANGGLPIMTVGTAGAWDDSSVVAPWVIRVSATDYRMTYKGRRSGGFPRTGYATSPDGLTWTKAAGNPVIDIGGAGNDSDGAFGAAWYIDGLGRYHLWYVGDSFPQFILYAFSDDNGATWTRNAAQVILAGSATASDCDAGVGDEIKMWRDDGMRFFTCMNVNPSAYTGDALGALEGRGLYWLPERATSTPSRPARAFRPIIGSGRAYMVVPAAAKLLNQSVFSIYVEFKMPPDNSYRYLYLEGVAFNIILSVAVESTGFVNATYRTATGLAAITTAARVDNNSWHRILFVRTAVAAFQVYIDGVSGGTSAVNAGTDATNPTYFNIGGADPADTLDAPLAQRHGAGGLIRRVVTIAGYAMNLTEESTLWNGGVAGGARPSSGTGRLDLLPGSGGAAGPDIDAINAHSCTVVAAEMVDGAVSREVPENYLQLSSGGSQYDRTYDRTHDRKYDRTYDV